MKQGTNRLRIGYFGDGPWSIECADMLYGRDDVRFVFDVGREVDINKDDEIRSLVKECDLLISMSYDKIFKKDILDLCPVINVHAGALPRYRGRNILNWALINGEKEFGITAHYVDEGIDTGDIICQRLYPINRNDNYGTLLKLCYTECAKVLDHALDLIQEPWFKATAQSSMRSGFYCTQRSEGDEYIDWNWTSKDIHNFVRALCDPGPMARTYSDGFEEIKINESRMIPDAPAYKCIPGAVVGFGEEHCPIIKTGDSTIELIDYEFNGKIKMGDRFL